MAYFTQSLGFGAIEILGRIQGLERDDGKENGTTIQGLGLGLHDGILTCKPSTFDKKSKGPDGVSRPGCEPGCSSSHPAKPPGVNTGYIRVLLGLYKGNGKENGN